MPASPEPGLVRWSRLVLDSYRDRLGVDLVPRTGDEIADARALDGASRVVLCHDTAADPVFVYANAAACRLWGIPRPDLVGMPSRLSAGPDARPDRAAMLAAARRDGVLRGYAGVRRAADGSLFEIRDAVIWTVDDGATAVGQAATFTDWTTLPPG